MARSLWHGEYVYLGKALQRRGELNSTSKVQELSGQPYLKKLKMFIEKRRESKYNFINMKYPDLGNKKK